MMHSAVRPYLMDLGSANGTYLNNERIEAERYYELLERVRHKWHLSISKRYLNVQSACQGCLVDICCLWMHH